MSLKRPSHETGGKIGLIFPIVSLLALIASQLYPTDSSSSTLEVEKQKTLKKRDQLQDIRLRLDQLLASKGQEESEKVEDDLRMLSTPELLNLCDEINLNRATQDAQNLAETFDPYLTPDESDELQSILDLGCQVSGIQKDLEGSQHILFKAPEPYDTCDVELVLNESWEVKLGNKDSSEDFLEAQDAMHYILDDEDDALETCLNYNQKKSVQWLEDLFPGHGKDFDLFSKAGCLPREVYSVLENGRRQLRVAFSAPFSQEICNYLYLPATKALKE